MNEKDHNINCSACQFHHLFLSLFVLTWRELQALLPNLFIFPKSDLPKLVFSLSTCAAYTQTFTVLVHMIISCKYTTRLIKCTMFLFIIMIIIIILQRSGDWTIPFPWCCWYVLEKLCSLVLRFWKSLSSCFCWTTVLWNALKAIKFIIDFIFHSLLNSILYLVLNRTSTEPSTAFSRYACVRSGKCSGSSKWGYKWSSRCNSQSKCKRFVSHGENFSYLQWN